jgi:ATPase subunit of ABC transporter with duplicated ATPase domains
MSLVFHRITFAFEGSASPLIQDLNVHFPSGWTGIIGPNGAGKTTILRLAANLLQPQQGSIRRPVHAVFCPQRTDAPPESFVPFIQASDAEACVLRGRLQIREDWAQRWNTLSHGERKRAQIGVALWQQPDLMLIDEPTNHMDATARDLLAEALGAFSGIGFLVSHDRFLLDTLCTQCLFLDPPQAILRPGNYTAARAEAEREEKTLLAERKVRHQHLDRLTRTARSRHDEAARADRKKSKQGLAPNDHDARERIHRARVSGKDGQAGRLARQLKGRLAQAQADLSALKVHKRYAPNFWLEGSVSPRQVLFSMEETSLRLDASRQLLIPGIRMLRQDRIAITGANGTGKSTLVRSILDHLHLPEAHLVYLPQEIDLNQTRRIMEEVHRLPPEQLGRVMTVVSALGSRPERLMQHLEASPGELRKVMLALGVLRRPHLIILDEPTNHLDLPAIESLEAALRDCPCGLLLVSHDLPFLSHLAHTRWHLHEEKNTRDITLRIHGGFHENPRDGTLSGDPSSSIL